MLSFGESLSELDLDPDYRALRREIELTQRADTSTYQAYYGRLHEHNKMNQLAISAYAQSEHPIAIKRYKYLTKESHPYLVARIQHAQVLQARAEQARAQQAQSQYGIYFAPQPAERVVHVSLYNAGTTNIHQTINTPAVGFIPYKEKTSQSLSNTRKSEQPKRKPRVHNSALTSTDILIFRKLDEHIRAAELYSQKIDIATSLNMSMLDVNTTAKKLNAKGYLKKWPNITPEGYEFLAKLTPPHSSNALPEKNLNTRDFPYSWVEYNGEQLSAQPLPENNSTVRQPLLFLKETIEKGQKEKAQVQAPLTSTVPVEPEDKFSLKFILN